MTTRNYTKGPFECDGIPKTNHASAKLKDIWLPWHQFVVGQTSGAATTLTAGASAGTVSSAELESALICGLVADDTKTAGVIIPVPNDMDVTASIAFTHYFHFAGATATGDKVTPVTLYKPFTVGTTALAVPATALDTVCGDCSWAVDSAIHASTGGIMNGSKLTLGQLVAFKITFGITQASAGEITFLGTKLTYTKAWL